jgi:hypothetical protein
MQLYIKVIDGQPVDHPVLLDNLLQHYGTVPPEYQVFHRLVPAGLSSENPFQKVETTYELASDGITWQDVHTVVDMTDEEKAELIAERESDKPGPNLTFDPTTLSWHFNTSMPLDGKDYHWDYETGQWVETTPIPIINTD